jgi:glycosyltransferase involved in cell wall biosynthesis
VNGNSPLVSIICISYNQSRFVKEAIQSVQNQSYKNIELIVVDDGSTDESISIIKSLNVTLIDLKKNTGYCKAFNEGWRASKGELIIDLAADDILRPDRIELGVKEFARHDESFGVEYGDAQYMDEKGKFLHLHSSRFRPKPDGDLYIELIPRYFICAASMMIRRSVLATLNGYDESLAYEDFDLWIRSSRHFKYFYTPQVLVNKRIVKGSMSDRQFEKGNPQQLSTYKVCEKILDLNQSKEEHEALLQRLRYELRLSLFRFDFGLASKYWRLIRNTKLLIHKVH